MQSLKINGKGNRKQPSILQAAATLAICIWMALSGCSPERSPSATENAPEGAPAAFQQNQPQPTPLPTRPIYQPGELVDYEAQTGDTIPALAIHFNTTEKEILANNPIIPTGVTTLPPGLPMKIPIYFQALWGSPYQILPDSLYVNGPAQTDFDVVDFVNKSPGGLKNYEFFTSDGTLRGGELIAHLAEVYSISPRLLLAIMEYQTGVVSGQGQIQSEEEDPYPLGFKDYGYKGLYRQLTWAANTLNNGYYGWRTGKLTSFEQTDGSLEHPDPWQNAASVALHYYFSKIMSGNEYNQAIHSNGIRATYEGLFGAIPEKVEGHIPGNLSQPELSLPFEQGKSWAFTGGPHTGWGEGEPFAAIDFAPPAVVGGCSATEEWATAVADGIILRPSTAAAELDLDGDGDDRTGWVVFYLHLSSSSIPPAGTKLKKGDPIGHPSCEGGVSTGTHVHIARKFNGEWIPASGTLAFNLEGWIASGGVTAYEGTMTRFSRNIRACVCSDRASQIQSGLVNPPEAVPVKIPTPQ